MQAATAAPVPAPTPTNAAPAFRAPGTRATPVNESALSRDLGRLADVTGATARNEASRTRSRERSSREETEQIKRRTRTPEFRRALESGTDQRPVAPRVPLFGDDEPSAFPTLPGTAGSSRPRAILA